jgi:glycosyltransferase involved in cell wall biosynthesis
MQKRRDEYQGKIIIGLTGSPTHSADWEVLRNVMPQLLEKNPDVRLLLMGYIPEYFTELDNVIRLPFQSYDQYAQKIRNCDIILAPVDPNDGFNLGKSPIKAIEGQAARRKLSNGKFAGAAVIATDNPIYRLAIKNGETGLLVEQTSDAWNNAIQSLIDSAERRERIQVQGHKWVYKHHDMSKNWKLWDQAYRKILAAPQNNIAFPSPSSQ